MHLISWLPENRKKPQKLEDALWGHGRQGTQGKRGHRADKANHISREGCVFRHFLTEIKLAGPTGLTGLSRLTGLTGTGTRILKSFKKWNLLKTFKNWNYESVNDLVIGPNPRDASASKNIIVALKVPTHQLKVPSNAPIWDWCCL